MINNFGAIKNTITGRILKQCVTREGYARISLSIGLIKEKKFRVNRLVCIAFTLNPLKKPTVNHLNFNRLDNYVENLA